MFPCKFPIKVMGAQGAGLEDFVRDTLEKQLKHPESINIKVRASEKGNFISVTATFEASSKDELDKLYQTISEHPHVKMAL